MITLRRLSSRAGTAAAVGVLAVAGTAGTHATAAAGGHPASVAGASYVRQHLVTDGALPSKGGSTHYMYVDEGYPGGGSGTDNIDVYTISGTKVTNTQTFATGADQTNAYFGSNTLALRAGGGGNTECLILADIGHTMIRSYSVSTGGQITGQVSAVADPNGYIPEDVVVSSNGSWAFLVDSSNYISTWDISSSCALTYASSSTGATDGPNYVNAALYSTTDLVATDQANQNFDTYSINPSTGALTFVASARSTLIEPDGITISGKDLFSGNLFGPTSLQGGTYSPSGTISNFTGSPAQDAKGPYGVPVAFDSKHSFAIEGDEAASSLLSNFHLVKTTISFKGETKLQGKSEFTNALTVLGTQLFVDGVVNGDIEACKLGKSGATGCKTVAVLPNAAGYSGGLVIL
ncbi:MAG TPA: hypothetical protein VKX16_05595 [Chloroflexota bacterium]|nr:hypothetical protein [Chloroflexota bacterium]